MQLFIIVLEPKLFILTLKLDCYADIPKCF